MKDYPRRPATEKYPICECGDPRASHKGDYKNQPVKYLECKNCMCPEFKFEKEMTMDEWGEMYADRHFNRDDKQ